MFRVDWVAHNGYKLVAPGSMRPLILAMTNKLTILFSISLMHDRITDR